jgi:hypothetical protein
MRNQKSFSYQNNNVGAELGFFKNSNKSENASELPEILFITSFPPRECGIATYSQDLTHSISVFVPWSQITKNINTMKK